MASATDDLQQLMPPPPPRPPRAHASLLPGDAGLPKEVLPEDEYTAQLEAIIERDFFPDIPKLQNQLEWAQAVNSGDPAAIRAAQISIARRRAGLKTPGTGVVGAGLGVGATPGTGWGVTPAALRTPAMTPLTAQVGGSTPALGVGFGGGATPGVHMDNGAAPAVAGVSGIVGVGAGELRAPPVSLDTFLAAHTSEDNASFSKLQDRGVARKRQKMAHHLEDKNVPLMLEGPGANPTEEFGTGGQQAMTLVMAKHNPTSALYYPPDQKPLSSKEATEAVKGATRTINHKGTRIKPETAEMPAALAAAVGLGPPPGSMVRGPGRDFSRLSTPALTPGALGESPFMTWGDIASTPLRLDGGGDGVEEAVALDPNAFAGPRFTVPAKPKREQTGHDLAAAKTIKELKRRQKVAADAVLAGGLPPGAGAALAGGASGLRATARPGTGADGGGAVGMSPAAQRLAHLVKRGATGARTPAGTGELDKALRASYSGLRATPSRSGAATPVGFATPGTGVRLGGGSTPVVGKAAGPAGATGGEKRVVVGLGALAATAKAGPAAGGAAVNSSKGLTDDLLKL